MSKPDHPAKLKKLKAKWEKKLKVDGLSAIYDESGRPLDHKSVCDLFNLIGFRVGFMEAIRDYYFWATGRVVLAEFKTRRDRKIWTMHASGMSSRDIAKEIGIDQAHISRQVKKIAKYLRLDELEADIGDFDYLEGAA